jgi:bisphosphoglycerate-dependent phosphoglycerate mutase
VWNVENKICGATDIALTELDHQQAIDAGKKILEEKIQSYFYDMTNAEYAAFGVKNCAVLRYDFT